MLEFPTPFAAKRPVVEYSPAKSLFACKSHQILHVIVMGKVVQTILQESEYERFRRAAKAAGLKVKDAVRSAVLAWTMEATPLNVRDPFFRSKGDDMGDPHLSTKVDETLYGKKAKR